MDLFQLKYYLDRYKTQEIYDEAVNDCLLALKFDPDQFVKSEMIKKLDDTLLANDDIIFINEE